MRYMKLTFKQGVALVIAASVMWGFSGVCGQFLFENYHTDPGWLITVRQLSAGLLFMAYLFIRHQDVLSIWKNKLDRRELLVFTFIGLLAAQFGFYVCIAKANAATGTILQYTGPAMVVLWFIFKQKRMPEGRELLGVFLSLLGVFLISTHGHIDQLVISPEALFWGIISAVGLAVYNIAPAHILKEYSTTEVMAWGQILSSIFLCFFYNPFVSGSSWDLPSVAAMSYIVVGGTIIPFTLFMMGLVVIGPTKASVIGCAEPLSSIIFVVVLLDTKLAAVDYLGMVCIIGTILLLSVQKK